MKNLIIFCFALFLFASCKKHTENAWSFWHIGTDSFSTNNVVMESRRTSVVVFSNSLPSRYDFTFPYGGALIEGESFLLVGYQPNSFSSCGVVFSIDTMAYIPSIFSSSTIIIEPLNGKETWDMADTWFINTKDPADSLLIGGHFSEP